MSCAPHSLDIVNEIDRTARNLRRTSICVRPEKGVEAIDPPGIAAQASRIEKHYGPSTWSLTSHRFSLSLTR
jgi:hypothetical protein